MSYSFTRTTTGLVSKWRFHQEPTIWVEGVTDISFYMPIVDDLGCRIEAFHGIENAKALVHALTEANLPYVVIMDGDYNILKKSRSPHRRAIQLKKYSFENYFWESTCICRCIHMLANHGEINNDVLSHFSDLNTNLEKSLRTLVTLDIAARNATPAPKVLPDKIDQICVDRTSTDICDLKAAKIEEKILASISSELIANATTSVKDFTQDREFHCIVKGHLLFGLIRRFIQIETTRLSGKKIQLNNDSLSQILIERVWKTSPSKEHTSLKSNLRKCVREAQAILSRSK